MVERDEFAFRLLCAFNGVQPEQAPEEWRFHKNEWLRAAWARVAEEAQRGPRDGAQQGPSGPLQEMRAE